MEQKIPRAFTLSVLLRLSHSDYTLGIFCSITLSVLFRLSHSDYTLGIFCSITLSVLLRTDNVMEQKIPRV
jgi:hypothetical protein